MVNSNDVLKGWQKAIATFSDGPVEAVSNAEPVGYSTHIKEQVAKDMSGFYDALQLKPPATPQPPVDLRELFAVFREVLRISDRKHFAWDRAKAIIDQHSKGGE